MLQSLEAAAVTYARMQDYGKASSYLEKLVSRLYTFTLFAYKSTPCLQIYPLPRAHLTLLYQLLFGSSVTCGSRGVLCFAAPMFTLIFRPWCAVLQVAARPGDVEALRLLGESRLLNAEPAKAVPAYEKAIGLAPDDQSLITVSATCLSQSPFLLVLSLCLCVCDRVADLPVRESAGGWSAAATTP
jgi:hypothetical protein